MIYARVSEKGQITLPARIRRKLNIRPSTIVEIEDREGGVFVRPSPSLSELSGIFHKYAREPAEDWETVRAAMEKAVAGEAIRRG